MVSVVRTTYDAKLEDTFSDQNYGKTDIVIHIFNDDSYETVFMFFSFDSNHFISEIITDDKRKLLTMLTDEGIKSEDANVILTNMVLTVDDIMFSVDYMPSKIVKLCATIQVHSLNNYFQEDGESSDTMISEAYIASQAATGESINNLEQILFVSSSINQEGEDITCPICLEMYEENCSLLKLPCGHRFDKTCILTWFENRHDCPICRFLLSM